MKRLKKLTAALIAGIMTVGMISFTAFAEGTLPAEVDGVIKLTDDATTDSIPNNKDITYDLNGHTLTYTGSTVSTQEGHKLSFIDSSVSGTRRGGTLKLTGVTANYMALNPQKNATVNASNIKIECTGSAFYPQGNAAEVNITSCDVRADVYCVGTNAGSKENTGVKINLKDSTFTSSSSDGDNTAVLMNVDGQLKITNCELTADRQALIVRAGDAVVKDSTITVTGKYAENEENNATKYQNGSWRSGNEVPMSAITVGNVTVGSYKADASLQVEDCKVKSENNDVPAVFSDANNDFGSSVEFIGEDTVVTGEIKKGTSSEASENKADIVIYSGTFSDESAKDYIDSDSQIAIDKDGKIVIMTEDEYEDYIESKKQTFIFS